MPYGAEYERQRATRIEAEKSRRWTAAEIDEYQSELRQLREEAADVEPSTD